MYCSQPAYTAHVYSVSDRIDNGNANSCPHCLEETNGKSAGDQRDVNMVMLLFQSGRFSIEFRQEAIIHLMGFWFRN